MTIFVSNSAVWRGHYTPWQLRCGGIICGNDGGKLPYCRDLHDVHELDDVRGRASEINKPKFQISESSCVRPLVNDAGFGNLDIYERGLQVR